MTQITAPARQAAASSRLNPGESPRTLAVCRALACQVLQITEFPLFYDLALGRGENTKTPKISALRLLAPESPTVC